MKVSSEECYVALVLSDGKKYAWRKKDGEFEGGTPLGCWEDIAVVAGKDGQFFGLKNVGSLLCQIGDSGEEVQVSAAIVTELIEEFVEKLIGDMVPNTVTL